ncbi:hypothetical protein PTKIN_Ptkin01aG0018700 [Pterospermum kingtungense]
MKMGSTGGDMVFVMLMFLLIARVEVAAVKPNPGCRTKCGNLSLPYPFGTEPDCFLDTQFSITCNDTTGQAFLRNSLFIVQNIDVLKGELRILGNVASDCYYSSRRNHDVSFLTRINYVSHTRNKFIAIGCDTNAFISGSSGQRYATGCLSLCQNITDLIDGSCSGIGCCQADIPRGVRDYSISLDSYYKHSEVSSFNPCSYAFIAEDGAYNFSVSDLKNFNARTSGFPMILDWRIGNQSCSEARKDPESYACKENTICKDPDFGNGYLCNCSDGFQGNPYLSNGCKDIDECKISSPCHQDADCLNLPGSFNCICRHGHEGDGKKDGKGCSSVHKREGFPYVNIALGVSISLLVLVLSLSWTYWWLWQRKVIRHREKFFQENGGIILQQEFSKHKGPLAAKIFTVEELKKATNNYHESRILGRGGQGTVYKGILSDGRSVAIKRSIIGDRSQVQQFINEVIVLSQINHRNVVKILGCCLETQVPLVVYEFVSNGTLFDHLHDAVRVSVLSWENRLRIATETADVLSYLHSAASPPIIHRDVKLTNILLDENYNAKVSDFGASRLNPSDKAQITTLVQGTLGYLDPEYFHTSQLTEKSDVYSFGVVLIELLTGLKALSFERPEQERNLSMYFVSMIRQDRLLEILDRRVMNEKTIEPLKEVAALARRCVRLKGEERPTMKEVALELEGLREMEKHPWGIRDLHEEEIENLLDNDTYNNHAGYDGSTSISMEFDSIKQQVRFDTESAR